MIKNIFKETVEIANKGSPYSDEMTMEELYQAFKDRLLEEIKVNSDELLNNADIIDIEPNQEW